MVQLVYCMKVAEPWAAKSLRDGTAWFSMIDRYIQIALQNHNDEQGDEYEGVFARQKKNSPYVAKCRKMFKDDLEILKDPIDNEHCLLRRKSSRDVCAFCMYGVKTDDLQPIGEPYRENGLLMCKYEHYISQDMVDKFLDDGLEVASVSASVGHLYEAIDEAVHNKGGKVYRQELVYDLDFTKEFHIKKIKWKQRKANTSNSKRRKIGLTLEKPQGVAAPWQTMAVASWCLASQTNGRVR